MENQVGLGIAAIGGVLLGYVLARLTRQKPAKVSQSVTTVRDPDWWEIRKVLTGSQLQILQFLEAKKHATIADLQGKFESIPDRELYYRLEQIVLLQFASRGREQAEVVYTLSPAYAATIEVDKTVTLSSSS
jgi:hypothetical protein